MMFGDGLEKEVIIRVLSRVYQESPSMFGPGGIREYDFDRLDVWANEGLTDNFSRIPGVLKASTQNAETNYLVYVDPRYNLKWVMAEIEAVAKTEKPRKKRISKNSSITFSIFGVDFGGVEQQKPKSKRKPKKKRGANDR